MPEVFLLVSLCRIWVWAIQSFNSETPPVIVTYFPELEICTNWNKRLCFTDHSVGKRLIKKVYFLFLPSVLSVFTRFCKSKIPNTTFPWKYVSPPDSDLKFLLMVTVSFLNILRRIKYLKSWSWESQTPKHWQFSQLFSQHEPASFLCLRKHTLSCFIMTKLLQIVRFRQILPCDLAGVPAGDNPVPAGGPS